MAYENPIKAQDTQDLGTAIQSLIRDNIHTINTAYLAKVESVEGNRVNITQLLKDNQNEPDTIISNALIAQPFSQEWNIQFNISVGDIGLAIVSKQDISTYKSNGSQGIVNTQRKFDMIDSIFIPLSLFLQKDPSDLGLVISNKAGDSKIEFSKNGKLTIQASDITIKGENPLSIGTSKTIKACFETIIDNLENGIIGGATQTGGTITALPAYQAFATQAKQTISEVLQ